MDSKTDIIGSITRAFELRSLLTFIVVGFAFHWHAVRITKMSPLAHPELWATSVQNPVIVICAFATVLASIGLGALASIWLWRWWPFHRLEPRSMGKDYVPLGQARRLALRERDTLWIERTDKAEAARQRSCKYKEQNERRLFAVLILLILDVRRPESALVILTRAMGFEDALSLPWVLCAVVGSAWCALVLWDNSELDWIEHPELAAKNESEVRASAIAAQALRQSMAPATHTAYRST